MGTKIFLALGSNLGDKLNNLKEAESLLNSNNVDVVKVSNVYITQPYGYIDQDTFLNECLLAYTQLSPNQLLALINRIETRLKRKRIIKWGPRTIDIDILFYGNSVINSDDLTIPHPEIQLRDFVLRPLMDLDPEFVHPVLNLSIKALYSSIRDNCELYVKN